MPSIPGSRLGSGLWQAIQQRRPPLSFLTLHYAYFIIVCLLGSIIFWGSSTPAQSISFTDALFLCVSAMTEAGLNTVNLSVLNTWQQFMLFALIMLGSTILVSSAVVVVRKRAFERRFAHIIEQAREERRETKRRSLTRLRPASRALSEKSADNSRPEVDGVVVRGAAIPASADAAHAPEIRSNDDAVHVPPDRRDTASANLLFADASPAVQGSSTGSTAAGAASSDASKDEHLPHGEPKQDDGDDNARIRFADDPAFEAPGPGNRKRVFSLSGVGARPLSMNHPRYASSTNAFALPLRVLTDEISQTQGRQTGFFKTGLVSRNSQFHALSIADRDRLGGVEYRALRVLEVIVPLYYVLFQLFGAIGLGAWVALNAPDSALQNGLNPWWVGSFNAISAFNNSGMSLLDANMVAYQTSRYMLITMGLLILAGNTSYPIFLRLILWTLLKLMPSGPTFDEWRHTIQFLLAHPRRCYTTLFPAKHTWWLLASLIALNGIDWIMFEVLNIGNNTLGVTDTGSRVIDGLFQALAVRSGGFYVVPIANLSIALLVLYVFMMYISVYPVTMTMRNSNVYEERSLGIYADDPAVAAPSQAAAQQDGGFLGKLRRTWTNTRPEETGSYFVRQQLRSQLAHDLWWLCLAIWLIVIIESGSIQADPVDYSVFNIIFEVVSAYGTVGISVGLPNVAYSFSGGWHVLSKLILCAVMLRGRHRGLPVAIDRAVLLPGEHLGAAEEEDARLRAERTLEKMSGRPAEVTV